MIDDPLGFIGTPALGVVMAIALGAVTVFGRMITAVGPPRSEKPVRLELPLTTNRATTLIESWRASEQLDAMRRWVMADFPWIVAYSASIAIAGSLAGRAAAAGLDSPDAETVGAAFTYAGFVAGALDVLENFGMLAMLGGHLSQPVPLFTTVVSALKWLLIGIAVIGSLGLLIASAVAELI
jgi:hypothetical protein